MRWDDIEILRLIDHHQEQHGGGELWSHNGMQLMEEIAGETVSDQNRHFGFIRELHNLRDGDFLQFHVDTSPGGEEPRSDANPYYYLQQVRRFSLTVKGQDRARGRVIVRPLPAPDEDDGRPISHLILQEVGAAIEGEYRSDQVHQFLLEAGIPPETISTTVAVDVSDVLAALDRSGSEGRRILRGFLGQWLGNQLLSGPSDELRVRIVEQFARQGWFVNENRLVIGERVAGRRVTSPLLRDARIAALHESIADIAEKHLRHHPATAVFEAFKAVTNRVKDMTQLESDGVQLMGAAFGGNPPRFALADRGTQTGINIHEGFAFLLRGAVQALRNPPAHAPLADMDDNAAFERLSLASLLMHQLDQSVALQAGAVS